MPAAASSTLNAHWFDGRSSRPRPARLTLTASPRGPQLSLHALDGTREVLTLTSRQVGWPERWSKGNAPPRVVVDLGDHGSVQVQDVARWQAALAQAGHRPDLTERMQTHWRVLLAVLLLAGGAIWAFYRWGTPWAATQITRHVPLSWEQSLSDKVMAQMDERWLKPSRLPQERQAALRARFDQLTAHIGPEHRRYAGYQPKLTLQFRSGIGPNAFALPGGTVVMTDDMVEQAANIPHTGDDALVGVLAHEVGHVMHRHSTRMVVEQGVLNIGLGVALGDVSTLVSSGASLLTGLAYSRSHETESDCYAIALMRQAQLPTAPMADLLLGIDFRMAAEMRRATEPHGSASTPASAPASAPKTTTPSASQPAVTRPPHEREPEADWFSTHPDTAGRAARLKAGTPEGC
ncbi:M48 family metallopeptidase [Ottowia sp.]|uniref:M48 family metallopeptidase n=1 Tax=Ottowia sp. TaxID=1898956 RepID=UPI003A8B27E6